MFSQELENLIQATLEDGMLEDFEKAALVKRAQAEGVDLTELEIYINSILQKRQREKEDEKNAQTKKKAQEMKEAFGRVCPSCGKQVPPMTLKCECGYEFTNSKSVSSVQLLFEKIEKIQSAPMKSYDPRSNEYKTGKKEQNNMIRQTISLFPVPNTKEDIIEFLSLSVTKSKRKGGMLGTVKGILTIAAVAAFIIMIITMLSTSSLTGIGAGLFSGLFYGALAAYGIYYIFTKKGADTLEENKTADAWHDKFEQVLMKGRSLRGDPDFQKQLDYYANLVNQKN